MDPLHVLAYGQERVAEFRGDAPKAEPWVFFAKGKKDSSPETPAFFVKVKQFFAETFSAEGRHVRS